MLFPSERETLFNYRGWFWARCEDLDATLIFTTWKNDKRQMVLGSFQRAIVRGGETKALISQEGC